MVKTAICICIVLAMISVIAPSVFAQEEAPFTCVLATRGPGIAGGDPSPACGDFFTFRFTSPDPAKRLASATIDTTTAAAAGILFSGWGSPCPWTAPAEIAGNSGIGGQVLTVDFINVPPGLPVAVQVQLDAGAGASPSPADFHGTRVTAAFEDGESLTFSYNAIDGSRNLVDSCHHGQACLRSRKSFDQDGGTGATLCGQYIKIGFSSSNPAKRLLTAVFDGSTAADTIFFLAPPTTLACPFATNPPELMSVVIPITAATMTDTFTGFGPAAIFAGAVFSGPILWVDVGPPGGALSLALAVPSPYQFFGSTVTATFNDGEVILATFDAIAYEAEITSGGEPLRVYADSCTLEVDFSWVPNTLAEANALLRAQVVLGVEAQEIKKGAADELRQALQEVDVHVESLKGVGKIDQLSAGLDAVRDGFQAVRDLLAKLRDAGIAGHAADLLDRFALEGYQASQRIKKLIHLEVCDGLDNDGDGEVDEGFDRDGDHIADCFDNCLTRGNPLQEDSDGDGIGDACEVVLALGFRRGDVNSDRVVDISDALATFGYLFLGWATPACLESADSDDSGELDITDGIYTLQFLFTGGPAITEPGPFRCGTDPSPDPLSCRRSTCGTTP